MKRLIAGALLWLAGAAMAATLAPVQLLNPAGSTAGQAIVSTGPSSAPAWGAVTATALAPVSPNTVIGNATNATLSPQAYPVPGCAAANSALQYFLGSGFSCGSTFALTTGNLSQFASTTSAQLAGVISNETGSGVLVFGTSPTLTTPNIVGTTAADNAAAGSVGQYATNSATGTNMTTATAANCATISLTAGDWDVFGTVTFVPDVTTTVTLVQAGINTTSATMSAANAGGSNFLQASFTTGGGQAISTPVVRIPLAATTTVYLVGQTQFGVSTMQCSGFIRARRVR